MDVLSQQQLHQPPQQALQIPDPLVQRQVNSSTIVIPNPAVK